MFGSELAKGRGSSKGRLFWKIFGTDLTGSRVRALNVKRVLREIKDPEDILDAGCGDGCYSYYLSRRYPNAQITAVDVDRDLIENCKIISGNLRTTNLVFKISELENLTCKEAFDLICCIDVLHYIEEDEKAIKRLRDSLRPGGLLILHVPILEQRDWDPSWGPSKVLRGAVRPGYDLGTLMHFMEETGFEIKSVKYTFGFWAVTSRAVYYQICKIRYLHSMLKFALFPVILFICYLDSIVSIKSGQGCLICAEPSIRH